ncbi:hypothetical protein ABBQ32_007082 [Trebouxia sp. C0010 RCD-2024]
MGISSRKLTVLSARPLLDARMAELEASNKGALQELADTKAESNEPRESGSTIEHMKAQLGQLKAQPLNKLSFLPLWSSWNRQWPQLLLRQMPSWLRRCSRGRRSSGRAAGGKDLPEQHTEPAPGLIPGNQLVTIQSQLETEELQHACSRAWVVLSAGDCNGQVGEGSALAALEREKAVGQGTTPPTAPQREAVARLHEDMSNSTDLLQAEVAEWQGRCEVVPADLQLHTQHKQILQLELELKARATLLSQQVIWEGEKHHRYMHRPVIMRTCYVCLTTLVAGRRAEAAQQEVASYGLQRHGSRGCEPADGGRHSG